MLIRWSLSILSFLLFFSLPSLSGGCCGNSCSGNMQVAGWGPSNYQERPIYPMRGCGASGCQKGWRSAIVYPPPSKPYGGQVISNPPIGCGMPVSCSPPIACGGIMPPPSCGQSNQIMIPPPPQMNYMPFQPPMMREPIRGLW